MITLQYICGGAMILAGICLIAAVGIALRAQYLAIRIEDSAE